ncbi:MAG: hypothetical protein N2690_01100 [Rhodocyclaceae bacterium]|nr:hypothetical protein [Rhodocyclaceae bacterium]
MNVCPVMNDLYRHLAEEERREAREEAIEHRAMELDEADVIEMMLDTERSRLALNLKALCYGTPESQSLARAEIRRTLMDAAMRIAEAQLRDEELAAMEDAAADYWEARQGCDAWA